MNLGMPEILIILVVALLLFGPRKLPELGRSLGSSIREFKKGAQSIRDEFESTVNLDEKPKTATPQAAPAASTTQTEEAPAPVAQSTENKS